MRALNSEAMLAVAVLAGCALFSFVIVPAGVDTAFADPRDLGPRFILDIASAGMAVAALAALARIGFGRARAGEEAGADGDAAAPPTPEERKGARRVLIVLAALGVYAFVLIDLIGFYVASVVTLSAVTWLLGERRTLLVALYALVLTASIYVLFEIVLQSRLPKGWILQAAGLS